MLGMRAAAAEESCDVDPAGRQVCARTPGVRFREAQRKAGGFHARGGVHDRFP